MALAAAIVESFRAAYHDAVQHNAIQPTASREGFVDASRFDSFARAAASAPSRRVLLGAALGALASATFGKSAEAAAKRRNGEICRNGGDCLSNNCGAKGATGRRRCQCATECIMLDDSPGDCSSGFCTCNTCAGDAYICLQNTAGRFAQGTFFVLTPLSIDSMDENDPLAGFAQISSEGLVTAADADCAVDADCANPLADILCVPSQPFCIEGGTCAVFVDCRDDGPVTTC